MATPDAATTFAAQGSIEPADEIIARWSGGLFAVFTYVAGGSLVALGIAIVAGASLPGAGWLVRHRRRRDHRRRLHRRRRHATGGRL